MWEESWVNLVMKMRDMPYYHYKGKKDGAKKKDTVDAIPGNADILIKKFGKYAG